MSGPRPLAAQESRLRNLTERLKTEAVTPAHRLSPIEERLLLIAKTIFIDCVICVRANQVEKTGEPVDRIPVSEAISAQAARLALAAAVEMEKPLREVRDRLEAWR